LSCSDRREEKAIAKKPKRRINGEGSIYQRKSDGRWVGQFRDLAAPGSAIRYVYAKTQQDALKKLKDEMARAQAGRTNVSEYLGWWMENVVSGEVAHRTYHNYLSQIRNHILPAFGKKKLKALKLEDVEGLYRSMVVSGLSPTTVRYVHAVMRRALGQAVNRGLVPRNVAEGPACPALAGRRPNTSPPNRSRASLGRPRAIGLRPSTSWP
jgi:integrase